MMQLLISAWQSNSTQQMIGQFLIVQVPTAPKVNLKNQFETTTNIFCSTPQMIMPSKVERLTFVPLVNLSEVNDAENPAMQSRLALYEQQQPYRETRKQ